MSASTNTGSTMARKSEKEAKPKLTELQKAELKNESAFHSRYSHAFGWVRLYAPEGDVTEWNNLPWKVTYENSPDGPVTLNVKYQYVMEIFNSPGLMYPYKEFGAPDPVSTDTEEEVAVEGHDTNEA